MYEDFCAAAVSVANTVPEPFRESAFQEVLRHLLSTSNNGHADAPLGAQQKSLVLATPIDSREKKNLSLVEFVRSISPTSGPEYVVTIGAYIEQTTSGGFTSSDIRSGLITAKVKLANPSDALLKAKIRGLVMDSGNKGGFVLTRSGEQWIAERSPKAA